MQLLLHEAMEQLPRGERLCVMMSYLQEKTHGQVASAMGLSQEAARKRIYRGVERMREFIMSRGVAVPMGAVAAALAMKCTTVSAAFVESTANVAVLAQAPGAASTAAIIAKGAATMLFTNKLKVAAALALGATLIGAATGGTLKLLAGPAARVPAASAPAVSVAPMASNAVDLGDGVQAEFVGIAQAGSDQWHDFAGKAIPAQHPPENRVRLSPAPTHQLLIHVTRPRDAAVQINIAGAGGFGLSNRQDDYFAVFNVTDAAKPVDLTVSVADGPWQDLLKTRGNLSGVMSMSRNSTGAIFFEPIAKDTQSLIYVAVSQAQASGPPDQWRVVCIDKGGVTHEGKPSGGGGTATMQAGQFLFDLPTDQIDALVLQTRSFHKKVEANHIPLTLGAAAAEIVTDHQGLP